MMGDGAAAIIVGADDCAPGAHISGSFFGQIGLDRPPGVSLCTGGSEKPLVDGEILRFEHDFAAVRASGWISFTTGPPPLARSGPVSTR
jgi:hypothetical protein